MSKQMEAQLRQAKEARADAQAEVARLKEENQRLSDLMKVWQSPGVPEGWKLVPVEPTPLMAATFRADNEHGAMTWSTHTSVQCADFDSRYRAMLAAAPEPPSVPPAELMPVTPGSTIDPRSANYAAGWNAALRASVACRSENTGIEKACQRYTEMILDMSPNLTAARDDTPHSWGTSGSHLLWMLEQIPTLPPTKAHRWLGFIQGALVYCGITSVDAEREATRGMFDEGPSKQETSHD